MNNITYDHLQLTWIMHYLIHDPIARLADNKDFADMQKYCNTKLMTSNKFLQTFMINLLLYKFLLLKWKSKPNLIYKIYKSS